MHHVSLNEKAFDLPKWLPCVMILADGDTHDITAKFEMLHQLRLIRSKVNVFDEDTSLVRVVRIGCVLAVLTRVVL